MQSFTRPIARTPLHHWHTANRARFVDSDGWQIPSVYSTTEQEIAVAREAVGVADVSAFAKISLVGQSVDVVSGILMGDSHVPNPLEVARFDARGPALACRLMADHLLLLGCSTAVKELHNRLQSACKDQSVIHTDVTTSFAGFCLMGPLVADVLRSLTLFDVTTRAFAAGSCAETGLAGVQTLLVRPPETQLAAIFVYVAWDTGGYVWERLIHAGRRRGIMPIGLEAWHQLIPSQ